MKVLNYLIAIVLITSMSCTKPIQEESISFLHTDGQNIVNENREKIYLKGVGLGNWLLPEGYMWKFGKNGDRPRKIEKIVSDLIGQEKADKFWLNFRQNYITEADIQRIAELGFNSVRPALNSRRFLSEEKNPVYVAEGFQLLDSLVSWCKKHKLYIIIDMHGAPGGQTGQNIDDSPNDLPELFMEEKYQDQLVELWVKIAERYKDEPIVAAYDLLNEPLPAYNGSAEKYKHLVEPLYKRITTEIRKVDKKHMITLEGVNWSNDWSIFGKPFDNNTFYQFHYYCWDKPDNLKSVDKYIKYRDTLNVPVWVGETGEKGNTIYWATAQYFETNNIGFSFWPWKKMDTQNTPYSVNKPENWDLIAEYSKGGEKPDRLLAEKAFNELLNNIKLNNCEFYQDVTNAILLRIPGKIEAENYGHNGFNQSYFVKDTSIMSINYRQNEPVAIELLNFKENQFWSEQHIVLKQSEWTEYTFNNIEEKNYQLTIKILADIIPTKSTIILNGHTIDFEITYEGWNELELGTFIINEGETQLRINAVKNNLKVDWFRFEN